MKIELSIDCTKKLLKFVVSAIEKELLKRLQSQFDESSLVTRRAGSNGLSVYYGEKGFKKEVEDILPQTWESADDRFFNTACNNFPVWRGYW